YPRRFRPDTVRPPVRSPMRHGSFPSSFSAPPCSAVDSPLALYSAPAKKALRTLGPTDLGCRAMRRRHHLARIAHLVSGGPRRLISGAVESPRDPPQHRAQLRRAQALVDRQEHEVVVEKVRVREFLATEGAMDDPAPRRRGHAVRSQD